MTSSPSAVAPALADAILAGDRRALAREGVHAMLHGLGEPAEIERTRATLVLDGAVLERLRAAGVHRLRTTLVLRDHGVTTRCRLVLRIPAAA